jgi:thiamine-phosphate pyrophosphorylase
MDQKLLAWGMRGTSFALPRLWLFTDERRLSDPRSSVARLPPGKAGVVLRHDDHPDRPALARDLAQICRERRLILVVAGDVRLAAAVGAGMHLRAGRWPGGQRTGPSRHGGGARSPFGRGAMVTSSAHGLPDLRRARKAGASLVFLSPVFPTASHTGVSGLGPLRWAAMVRRARHVGPGAVAIGALGGVDGRSLKHIPMGMRCAIGAIGALSADA